ncbi:MAG: L,D-transpeptidase [Thermoleophilaceae bacterium]|nr:L,D-transpeptidase [Thermoleophilaceae bacterium]
MAALLATAVAGTLASPAQAGSRVPASRPLVALLHDRLVRAAPSSHARLIESVSARRPLTGVRTVLPVLRRTRGRGGGSWIHVRLPGRPNGHSGWIRARQTRAASTVWRLAIDISARRVTVYRRGHVKRRFPAVVGKASTPTPRGLFFVEEALALSPTAPGNPFALATSARSNVLQEFEGGPGQIALHGTEGLSGVPGTAASHGCVRVATSAITWLARRIGSGVPLTIRE